MPFGTDVDLVPMPHCLRWGSAPPPPGNEHRSALFLAHVYTVAKRSPISATAELLFLVSGQSLSSCKCNCTCSLVVETDMQTTGYSDT